ncbi:MAG TPA: hypothetical protein VFL46_02575 [Phycicoccus sp.]|nr:hypothetical protein [Phycicoccus sp.]
MSLATTIGAGTLLGGLLAVGVYTAIAPSDAVPASVHVAPTYAPVPTPTVTVEAEDCVAPAVLEGDECVVHQAGPTTTLPAMPVAPARTHDATTAPRGDDDADEQNGTEAGDDSHGEDQESEHESDHHDDGDHEDQGGGEHEDD